MAKRGTHVEVSADTSKYERAMRDMRRSTKSTTDTIKTSWLKAAGAVYTLIKAWDTAKLAARAKQEEQSFRSLAASYGTNANKIIRDLKRASAQTIDTMTLIQKAGTAMMMGIAPDKLSRLMEIARATSRMTGQTVTKSFEDISLAVGRQSKMILDNLGIIVKVSEANEAYAKKLGKTADRLTEAEKKQAFLNATIREGEELMGRLGTQGKTAAETLQQMEAMAKNMKQAIGTFLLPPLRQLTEYLMNAARYWSRIFSTDVKVALEKKRDVLTARARHIEKVMAERPMDAEAKAYHQKELNKVLAELATTHKSIQNYENVPYEKLPPLKDYPGDKGGHGGVKMKSKLYGRYPAWLDKGLSPASPFAGYGSYAETMAAVKAAQWAKVSGAGAGPGIGAPFYGMNQAAESYSRLLEQAKSSFNLMDTLARNTAKSMQDSFTNFFFDAMQGKLKTLGDYVTAFVGAIQRSIAAVAAKSLVSWAAGYLPFLKVHRGGVIGGPGIPAVMMPATLLRGARRYHAGLRPDEFPAILQRGERVTPRGGDPGGGPVIYNDFKGAQFWDQEMLYKSIENISAAQVVKLAPGAVIKNYEANGPMRDLIRSAR